MNHTPSTKPYWTARELAARYGMNYKVVLEMLDSGKVAGAFRPGERGRWRIDKAVFLDSLKVGESEDAA